MRRKRTVRTPLSSPRAGAVGGPTLLPCRTMLVARVRVRALRFRETALDWLLVLAVEFERVTGFGGSRTVGRTGDMDWAIEADEVASNANEPKRPPKPVKCTRPFPETIRRPSPL